MTMTIYLSNGDNLRVDINDEDIDRMFTGNADQLITLDHPKQKLIINLKHVVYIEEVQ